MTQSERQQQITDYFKIHKKAEISFLSQMFQVSEMTVRRDLDQLEADNFLIRIHGGAVLANTSNQVAPINIRLNNQKEAKDLIGKYAASIVKSREVILMDDSSTCLSMLPLLPPYLTVITNCITIASTLTLHKDINVILLGGEFNKSTQSTAGKDMERMLNNYHVNKAFISSTAMDPKSGLFDGTISIAETKRAFMNVSSKVYYLCDHTKLHTFAISKVCELKDISTIIMDSCDSAKKEQLNLKKICKQQKVELVLV